MCGPANEIIDSLMAGESTMAALVGKNPNSRSHTSLEEAVCGPGENAQRQRWDQMDVEGSVDQSRAVDDIPKQVEQGSCERGFKTFLWDCILKLFQRRDIGMLWNIEISICIQNSLLHERLDIHTSSAC